MLVRAPPRRCQSSRTHQFARGGDKFSQSKACEIAGFHGKQPPPVSRLVQAPHSLGFLLKTIAIDWVFSGIDGWNGLRDLHLGGRGHR